MLGPRTALGPMARPPNTGSALVAGSRFRQRIAASLTHPPLRVVKLRQVRQSRASSSAARNCSISICCRPRGAVTLGHDVGASPSGAAPRQSGSASSSAQRPRAPAPGLTVSQPDLGRRCVVIHREFLPGQGRLLLVRHQPIPTGPASAQSRQPARRAVLPLSTRFDHAHRHPAALAASNSTHLPAPRERVRNHAPGAREMLPIA